MTNKEAIKEIKLDYCESCSGLFCKNGCIYDTAIKALENADKLWEDNFEEWYERYHENMNCLNDLFTKAEKYKWHDLRKNPDDLPPRKIKNNITFYESDTVMIAFKTGEICLGQYHYASGHSSYFGRTSGWIRDVDWDFIEDVIAWKELELFEEI